MTEKAGISERRDRSVLHSGYQAIARAVGGLFGVAPAGVGRWASVGWYLAIFVVGAVLWAYILNWGEIHFGLGDWAEGTGHRLAFLQNAVRSRQLPLHMPDGSALRNVTDRFISTPDTILSPQVLLLGVLDLGPFVLVNTLLLYAIGFVGMFLLGRRLGLSAFAFGVVFVLFALNGHITDHVVVGQMHWVGYFLLPFFVHLILDAVDGRAGWSWVLKIALALFFMFLQGAYHLFVMSLIFLLLCAVSSRRLAGPALIAVVFSILLSLGRILPPGLEAGRFDSEFLSGFTTVGQMLSAFVELREPIPEQVFAQSLLSRLGWWEIDHFLGVLGLAFVVGYGLIYAWISRDAEVRYRALSVPIFAMAFLSIGRIFKVVNALGIPLLSSQRVSTRFVVFSLIFLLVVAGRNLQAHLGRLTRARLGKALCLALFGLGFHDLWQHIKLWRVDRMPDLFRNLEIDLTGEFVANHPDPAYAAALGIGWGIALLSLGVLMWLSLRGYRLFGVGGEAASPTSVKRS
jgi:hypothetical protein